MRCIAFLPLALFLSSATLIGAGVGGKTGDDRTSLLELAAKFARGDVDQDGDVNIPDAMHLASYLFQGGGEARCADAADANDDGYLDISDVVHIMRYVSQVGPAPSPPFGSCGYDPTKDRLRECEFDACRLWAERDEGERDFDPGPLNPLWENRFLWVYYHDLAALSVSIADAFANDPLLEEAIWTQEVEMLAGAPDRVVFLTPKSEEEAVVWIAENQDPLAGRKAPVYFFLLEGGKGAALLDELLTKG